MDIMTYIIIGLVGIVGTFVGSLLVYMGGHTIKNYFHTIFAFFKYKSRKIVNNLIDMLPTSKKYSNILEQRIENLEKTKININDFYEMIRNNRLIKDHDVYNRVKLEEVYRKSMSLLRVSKRGTIAIIENNYLSYNYQILEPPVLCDHNISEHEGETHINKYSEYVGIHNINLYDPVILIGTIGFIYMEQNIFYSVDDCCPKYGTIRTKDNTWYLRKISNKYEWIKGENT